MYVKINLSLIACVLAVFIGLSQSQEIKSVDTRITELEAKVAELEKRIEALEKGFARPIPSNPPSEEAIKKAITDCLKESVPVSLSGSLMGGKNAVLDLIEIQQIGNYNVDGKYWPVKARVKGTCDAQMLMSTEKHSFDAVRDFRIYQDDYGNWKAETQMFE